MYAASQNRLVTGARGLYGLGAAVYAPTEYDLALFTFSDKTALQKVGIPEMQIRFAIQFPPKFSFDTNPAGRWTRVAGAVLSVPGVPGQALWEWTIREGGAPLPSVATVLEQFVDHSDNTRHRRLADGKGGSYWVVDPLLPKGYIIQNVYDAGTLVSQRVADGEGGWTQKAVGGSAAFAGLLSSPMLWLTLVGVFYLFKGKK